MCFIGQPVPVLWEESPPLQDQKRRQLEVVWKTGLQTYAIRYPAAEHQTNAIKFMQKWNNFTLK